MKNNTFKLKMFLGTLALLATPLVAFAQKKDLNYIVTIIVKYFQTAAILIIGLAFVTFVWNVYRFFFLETEKRKEAGMYVLYSVIGFFVILSIWGLVAILTNTFDLNDATPPWPFEANTGSTKQPTDPYKVPRSK